MSLSRQAMRTGLHHISPRLSYPLYHLRFVRICARVSEQYGSQQVVAKADKSEAGPAVSVSGSESDSDSDSGFLMLEAEEQREGAPKALGKWAGIGSIGGIVLLLGAGVVLKDAIRDFLLFFIDAVDSWGPLGYLAYAAVYTGLEVLAVPAIPLTMTAGVIFGPIAGTIITSMSGTLAAAIAFLIARYAARERVLRWARRNSKFAAIDRAIARNGFKFVTLLRLSPLFPLAASNYLYGLTSVDLWSYIAGSWIGMLPGTYAYVSAGHLGKAALMDGEGSVGVESWQVALGFGVTLLAIGYVGRLAKTAIEEAEAGSDLEDDEEGQVETMSSSAAAPANNNTDSNTRNAPITNLLSSSSSNGSGYGANGGYKSGASKSSVNGSSSDTVNGVVQGAGGTGSPTFLSARSSTSSSSSSSSANGSGGRGFGGTS